MIIRKNMFRAKMEAEKQRYERFYLDHTYEVNAYEYKTTDGRKIVAMECETSGDAIAVYAMDAHTFCPKDIYLWTKEMGWRDLPVWTYYTDRDEKTHLFTSNLISITPKKVRVTAHILTMEADE